MISLSNRYNTVAHISGGTVNKKGFCMYVQPPSSCKHFYLSVTQPDYLLLNTIGSQITALGDDDQEARSSEARRALFGYLADKGFDIGIPVEGKFWFNAADARPEVNSNAITQLSRWVEKAICRVRSREA